MKMFDVQTSEMQKEGRVHKVSQFIINWWKRNMITWLNKERAVLAQSIPRPVRIN